MTLCPLRRLCRRPCRLFRQGKGLTVLLSKKPLCFWSKLYCLIGKTFGARRDYSGLCGSCVKRRGNGRGRSRLPFPAAEWGFGVELCNDYQFRGRGEQRCWRIRAAYLSRDKHKTKLCQVEAIRAGEGKEQCGLRYIMKIPKDQKEKSSSGGRTRTLTYQTNKAHFLLHKPYTPKTLGLITTHTSISITPLFPCN